MGCTFEVDEDILWFPALRVGNLYARFLCEIAEMLGESNGIVSSDSDMYVLDLDAFESLVRKMTDRYFSGNHLVVRGLLGGVLAPSMVMLERAGRPLSLRSDFEREFMAEARELGMPR